MTKIKTIPKSAGHTEPKKLPKADEINYSQMYPAWRFGNFDFYGPWGIKNLTNFKFSYDASIFQEVIKVENEELNKTLDALDNKEFDSFAAFLRKLSKVFKGQIPVSVIKAINDCITCKFFESIYPKLKNFERMTWAAIDHQQHGYKGKSSNHNVNIDDLGSKAKKRLQELGFTDFSEIYSLRIEGTGRIFGFRERNNLDIIWVDIDHSVYPVSKQK